MNPQMELKDTVRNISHTPDKGSASLAFVEPNSVNLYASPQRLADVDNGKVLVVGLQKSGNTWLHALLADTLDYPYLFSLDQVEGRGVLGTHLPFCDEIMYRQDFVHAVCIIRDLRDVVLSFFEYLNSSGYLEKVPYAQYADIDTFYYDWFLSRAVPAHRFHTFSAEYAERGVPIVRYERLVENPTREVARLFSRWGEPFDVAKIEWAVQRNSLDQLRRDGKLMGDVAIDRTLFNQGKVGRYKEKLPPHIIKDIEVRFGDVMARWGYL